MADLPIPINLIFEDDLQLAVLERILSFSRRNFVIGRTFKGNGFGYIKKNIKDFNHAATAMPYLIITDLDDSPCAPEKIRSWLNVPKNPNLLFRIAVHDIEAWILADCKNSADFLGVSVSRINPDVESLQRAKIHLLDIVKHSRKSSLKKDMLPLPNSTAKIGPNYNFLLTKFIQTKWDPALALENSDSLKRAIKNLQMYNPHWQTEQ